MGNTIASKLKRKSPIKVMLVDGTTFKLRPPATANDAMQGHPGLVVMDAEDVKKRGVKAKPLEPQEALRPKKLYFLVELPKQDLSAARRVRSAINMTAKDRLESLMLARRASSDISVLRQPPGEEEEGVMRVRMRLPRAEVARLVKESGGSGTEAAAKIVEVCVGRRQEGGGGGDKVAVRGCSSVKREKKMRFAAENEIIG